MNTDKMELDNDPTNTATIECAGDIGEFYENIEIKDEIEIVDESLDYQCSDVESQTQVSDHDKRSCSVNQSSQPSSEILSTASHFQTGCIKSTSPQCESSYQTQRGVKRCLESCDVTQGKPCQVLLDPREVETYLTQSAQSEKTRGAQLNPCSPSQPSNSRVYFKTEHARHQQLTGNVNVTPEIVHDNQNKTTEPLYKCTYCARLVFNIQCHSLFCKKRSCIVCHLVFENETSLKRHQLICHTNGKELLKSQILKSSKTKKPSKSVPPYNAVHRSESTILLPPNTAETSVQPNSVLKFESVYLECEENSSNLITPESTKLICPFCQITFQTTLDYNIHNSQCQENLEIKSEETLSADETPKNDELPRNNFDDAVVLTGKELLILNKIDEAMKRNRNPVPEIVEEIMPANKQSETTQIICTNVQNETTKIICTNEQNETTQTVCTNEQNETTQTVCTNEQNETTKIICTNEQNETTQTICTNEQSETFNLLVENLVVDSDHLKKKNRKKKLGTQNKNSSTSEKYMKVLKVTRTYKSLKHRREIKLKTKSYYKCPFCYTMHMSKDNFAVHMCVNLFVEPQSYHDHYKNISCGARIYCKKCKKTFDLLSTYNTHINKCNNNLIGEYKCPKCLLSFSYICQLNKHQLKEKHIETDLLCNICKIIIPNHYCLEEHANICKNNYVYVKNDTYTRLESQKAISIVSNSKKMYECLLCKTLFKTVETLDTHLQISHCIFNKLEPWQILSRTLYLNNYKLIPHFIDPLATSNSQISSDVTNSNTDPQIIENLPEIEFNDQARDISTPIVLSDSDSDVEINHEQVQKEKSVPSPPTNKKTETNYDNKVVTESNNDIYEGKKIIDLTKFVKNPLKSNSIQTVDLFVCHTCNNFFQSENLLIDHYTTCSKICENLFECPSCKALFVSLNILIKHIEQDHKKLANDNPVEKKSTVKTPFTNSTNKHLISKSNISQSITPTKIPPIPPFLFKIPTTMPLSAPLLSKIETVTKSPIDAPIDDRCWTKQCFSQQNSLPSNSTGASSSKSFRSPLLFTIDLTTENDTHDKEITSNIIPITDIESKNKTTSQNGHENSNVALTTDKFEPILTINVECDDKAVQKEPSIKFKKVLYCKKCSLYFYSQIELTKHYKEVHKNLPKRSHFKCRICSKYFLSQDEILNHVKSIHVPTPVNSDDEVIALKSLPSKKCFSCSRKFPSQINFLNHYLKAHTIFIDVKNPNYYRCNVCLNYFLSREECETHFNIAHDNLQLYYRLKSDDVIATSVTSKYKNVQELTYDTERKYKRRRFRCLICKLLFFNESDIKMHYNTHSKPKQTCNKIPCIYCNYNCNSVFNLNQHILKFHIACKLCNTFFESKSELQFHLQNHKEGKILFLQCSMCNSTFSMVIEFLMHLRDEHYTLKDANFARVEKQFADAIDTTGSVCMYCDSVFVSNVLLQDHIRKFHKVDECIYCRNKFAQFDAFCTPTLANISLHCSVCEAKYD